MPTQYIFVDYENIQPKDLDALTGKDCQIKIFLGANQTKIPVPLVCSLQQLGERVEYVSLIASGSNALDFHIAYYLGVLVERDRSGRFMIISRDTGFDPLIKHLRSRGVQVQRLAAAARKAQAATSLAPLEQALIKLRAMKNAKPASRKTLTNSLKSVFREKLDTDQIQKLIEELARHRHIALEGEKVSYPKP